MSYFTGVSLIWLLAFGALFTVVGIVLCYFFPDPWRREPQYEFKAMPALASGILISLVLGYLSHTPLVVIPAALIVGYILANLTKGRKTPEKEEATNQEPSPKDRIPFIHGWDARPRYETEEEGVFIGRSGLLDRLTSDFIGKRSGTILISGVRGVGKTSLVERALLEAKNKLQNRYWKKALLRLDNATEWNPIEGRIRSVLINYASENFPPPIDYLALKKAAEEYSDQPRRFWQKFNPIYRCIRRMREASRAQLLVLKFNASDIGGALAEPGQNALSGKPQVNPEKLLRALIRKLFVTFHTSRPKEEANKPTEAGILQWSLRDKKERRQFYQTLENAYNKSISKSYKEIVSNSVNEAIKLSQSSASEAKFSLERILLLLIVLAIGVVTAIIGWTRAWHPLQSYISSGVAGALAAYLTWSWTIKRSRDVTSDRARQAQVAYEYDYSLAQLEYDLRDIVRALHPRDEGKFDAYRCFTRCVIIFDELDKLEDPFTQLNDVITHFKNFFTLSEALFVFLTDHGFYEHLVAESLKAKLKRHYSEEHTFFTQKIYLRKPEFSHFNETVYRFCDSRNLELRAQQAETTDPDVLKFLLQGKKEIFKNLEQWDSLTNLTHLFLHRDQYPREQKETIERAFTTKGGWSNPIGVAQVWCGLVASGTDGDQLKTAVEAFKKIGGWEKADAVAFLYYRRSLFGEEDRISIEEHYKQLKSPPLDKYTSVDAAQFTLSDLARALCFRTRNHYFDLYYMVYDFVGSYADGAPVIHIEDTRFNREERLWSRYQQLIEAAFYHRRVDHPSREYFNALLMDALYSVFDSRAKGNSIKFGDITFSPGTVAIEEPSLRSAATPLSPWLTGPVSFSVNSTPSTTATAAGHDAAKNGNSIGIVDRRDADQINEAILKLLRLAIARKAISVLPPLAQKLKDENIKLDALATEQFTWNDDCEPLITQEGIELEPYEKELIKFWDENKAELEALNDELENLAAFASLLDESAIRKMENHISKLRVMAEGLRYRSITTSRPDATALKANFGSAEILAAQVPGFILERVRAEGDAETLLASDLQAGPSDSTFRSIFDSRRSEVEQLSKLPLRAVVFPHETKCLIYLLAGSVPADLDLGTIAKMIPISDAHLFWYSPGKEPGELTGIPESARFYFPPPAQNSVATLFSDYSWLARKARVNELIRSSKKGLKDKDLAVRVGAELIGPITPGSELVPYLGHSVLGIVVQTLKELMSDKARLTEQLQSVGFDITKDWSLDGFSKALTKIVSSRQTDYQKPPFDLEDLVRKAIRRLFGASDVEEPALEEILNRGSGVASNENRTIRTLMQTIISNVLLSRLVSAGIQDPGFQDLVQSEFSAGLVKSIEDLATSHSIELKSVTLTFLTSWASDLNKLRTSLKPSVISTR